MQGIRGFTLLETVVAVSIMTLIAWMLFMGFNVWGRERILDGAAAEVAGALREARSQTLASIGGTSYGVHLSSTDVTIFTGTSYVSGASTNRTIGLNPRVALSSSLTGGVTDVTFARLTGKPSATGTVTISLVADASQSRTITIEQSGLSL